MITKTNPPRQDSVREVQRSRLRAGFHISGRSIAGGGVAAERLEAAGPRPPAEQRVAAPDGLRGAQGPREPGTGGASHARPPRPSVRCRPTPDSGKKE